MNHSSIRLRIAGSAAVAAVVMSVTQVLITPAHLDGSTSDLVTAASRHSGGAYASAWAEMLWGLFAALACITVAGLAPPGRGHRAVLVGGWLNTLSLLGIGFGTVAVTQAAVAAGTSHATAIASIDAINGSAGLAPLLVLLFGGLIFPVVLGVGLARAGLVGWWYVGVTVLSIVFFIGLGGSDAMLLRLVAVVPTCVTWLTWAWLLRRALAESPEPVTPRATAATMA
jgi:hypothetical protein